MWVFAVSPKEKENARRYTVIGFGPINEKTTFPSGWEYQVDIEAKNRTLVPRVTGTVQYELFGTVRR